MIDYYYFLKNFIIGGLIISTVTYFTKKVDPKIASIVWSFPVKLITALFLLWLNDTDLSRIEVLGFSATRALVNKIIFVWLFANLFSWNYNFPLALGLSLLVWFLGSFILYYFW